MTEAVRLTRKQLHDLVWSKPMTAVSAQFGISDVGLAKRCKKENVPYPGRGYWAKVAAGMSPKRTPLPMPSAWDAEALAVTPKQKPVRNTSEREVVAVVVDREPGRVRHVAVKALDAALSKPYGDPPMTSLPGREHSVLRCSKGALPRCLAILDALFRSLEERGHSVRLTRSEKRADKTNLLEVVIGSTTVEIWLVERAQQTPHVLTPEEATRKKLYGYTFAHTYDRAPSGELTLEASVPWGTTVRHRWSDGKKHRLEDHLGRAVLDIEEIAKKWVQHAEPRSAERQMEEERLRERQRAERHQAHQKALGDDLMKMTAAWQQASLVRLFLQSARQQLSELQADDAVAAWLKWAEDFATGMDPLSKPDEIPKRTTPR